MQKPALIWLDMTLATQHAEIDPVLCRHFEIHHCTDVTSPEHEFDLDTGLGLCFDFDYPDRAGLELLRSTKERLPHAPILMLTIHHSERLAIWAYRNRVVDFLVKPITDDDIIRCHELLSAIQSIDAQDRRPILHFRSRIPSEIPPSRRLRHKRLLPALRYVEKNFRGKIRNADVAELCDMSQCHFSHEFAEAFSLTFQEYVLCYRILEACSELRHPNIPVTNVAYSVGFNDPSYFARVFRRYLGCSPTEYCTNADDPEFTDRRDGIARKLELSGVEFSAVDRRKADRRIANVNHLQTQ